MDDDSGPASNRDIGREREREIEGGSACRCVRSTYIEERVDPGCRGSQEFSRVPSIHSLPEHHPRAIGNLFPPSKSNLDLSEGSVRRY